MLGAAEGPRQHALAMHRQQPEAAGAQLLQQRLAGEELQVMRRCQVAPAFARQAGATRGAVHRVQCQHATGLEPTRDLLEHAARVFQMFPHVPHRHQVKLLLEAGALGFAAAQATRPVLAAAVVGRPGRALPLTASQPASAATLTNRPYAQPKSSSRPRRWV